MNTTVTTLAEINPVNSTCEHIEYYKLQQKIISLLCQTYHCIRGQIKEYIVELRHKIYVTISITRSLRA